MYAAELGQRGGLRGCRARAAALSAQRRRDIARAAARKRWSRPHGDTDSVAGQVIGNTGLLVYAAVIGFAPITWRPLGAGSSLSC